VNANSGRSPTLRVFTTRHSSEVHGVELSDGRRVVSKVRPIDAVLPPLLPSKGGLFEPGFPCPEPRMDACQLGDVMVTAETLVPAEGVIGRPPFKERAEMLAELVGLPAPRAIATVARRGCGTGAVAPSGRSQRAGYRPLRVGSAQPLLAGRAHHCRLRLGQHRAIASSYGRSLSTPPSLDELPNA
jgi:hypothetical protein